jgi:uncharacterized membrane protein HdeD (DUF308 family)
VTEPTPTSLPPTVSTPSPDAAGADEAALAAAKNVIGQNAPWKSGMRWEVVLAQGIVIGIVGLVIWLAPGFGATAMLQLLGLLLLVTSLLSVWRLLRAQVRPERVATVAFRAGVGCAVGLIVVIGALIVGDRDLATVAMAVVLGIGLILYGLSAAAGSLLQRPKGSSFPVAALLISTATIIVGLLLVVNGRNGIESLTGTFAILGVLLLVVGLALVGWAYVLRSKNAVEPED